jgi:putative sigma-54 modulation protein
MNVLITGRNVDVTPELRDLIENKVSRVARYFNRIQRIDVIIELAKYRHVVEMIVKADLITVQAHEAAPELRTAVDAVITKVIKQIRRKKEKLYRNKKHQKRPRIEAEV